MTHEQRPTDDGKHICFCGHTFAQHELFPDGTSGSCAQCCCGEFQRSFRLTVESLEAENARLRDMLFEAVNYFGIDTTSKNLKLRILLALAPSENKPKRESTDG